MKPQEPKLALFNGDADLVECLREVFEREGYDVSTLLISEVRRGREDFIAWIERHDPQVIVYDLPPPFEQSINFLKLIQSSEVIRGRKFILISTNAKALKQVTGVDALEVLGKPFDFDELIAAVGKATSMDRSSQS